MVEISWSRRCSSVSESLHFILWTARALLAQPRKGTLSRVKEEEVVFEIAVGRKRMVTLKKKDTSSLFSGTGVVRRAPDVKLQGGVSEKMPQDV